MIKYAEVEDKKEKISRFIEEVSPLIKTILWTRFRNLLPEEKDDIHQEVKLKLWKMLSRGKKIQNFQSYLKRVVFTTGLDLINRRWGKVPADQMTDSNWNDRLASGELFPLDFQIEREEQKIIVEGAIRFLSPDKRLVLKLHLTGMNPRETAEFLGWTQSKVSHLFYRSLEDLKAILKNKAPGKAQSSKGK